MIDFPRQAIGRVHNTIIDEFDFSDDNVLGEYEIGQLSDDEIEKIERRIDKNIENAREELEYQHGDLESIIDRITVYSLTEQGTEIKLTKEQEEAVQYGTPMLLPGVAGTGKSTVLQKRFRNDLE